MENHKKNLEFHIIDQTGTIGTGLARIAAEILLVTRLQVIKRLQRIAGKSS